MTILDFFKEKKIINSEENKFLNQILVNRVAGIVLEKLEQNNSLEYFSKEFIIKLKKVYLQNIIRNKNMISDIEFLCKILDNTSFKYAFLKGAYLIPYEYKMGMRVSNDIDILIEKNYVTRIQDILKENGFIQGNVKGGEIKAATRKEIINSKLNFGETVPFVKQFEERFLEVDLNISLDFKSDNEDRVRAMLNNIRKIKFKNLNFVTLNFEEFIIHLCYHLYKEATTYDWVRNNRNLLLYKFYDIYHLINKYSNTQIIGKLLKKISFYSAEKECYYTFFYVKEIFVLNNDSIIFNLLDALAKCVNKDCLLEIFYPEENKRFHYVGTFEDWFNSDDKVGKLIQIK